MKKGLNILYLAFLGLILITATLSFISAVVPTCTDTDGGDDRYVKGTINSPSQLTDRCYLLGKGFVDSCNGTKCTLEEYKCVDSNKDGVLDSYNSAISYSSCPDGCKNGACIRLSQPNPTNQTNKTNSSCMDTDKGLVVSLRGYCKDTRGSFADTCLSADGAGPSKEGAYVDEAYCMTEEMVQYCKKFNSASYCDNLPRECYFSPMLPPSSAPGLEWTYFPSKDEYFCTDGCLDGACINCTNYRYSNCPSSCAKTCTPSSCTGEGSNKICTSDCDGAGSCKSSGNKTSTTTKTCTDTDGGKNYFMKGNITEAWPNGGKVGYIDSCTDGITDMSLIVSQGKYLHETYCSGNEVSFEFYQCPNGCSDGACINASCVQAGQVGPNPSLGPDDPNKYKVCCAGLKQVAPSRAYRISNGVCDMLVGAGTICSNCGNGICESWENKCNCAADCTNQTTPVCTETDGGFNIYIQGNSTDSLRTLNDECVRGTQNVREFYCGTDGVIYSGDYLCFNGCENGACKKELDNESRKYCIDSDEGLNFNIKGNTTIYLYKNGENIGRVSYLDRCGNKNPETDLFSEGNAGEYVRENYCSGNKSLVENYRCKYGCKDGVCINETEYPVKEMCAQTGGIWKNFSNGCADYCEFVRGSVKDIECTMAIKESCDCGNNKCWTGGKCESNNVTKIVSCDSGCPFDNKCYPYGYRKAGRYCTDNNEFIKQSLSEEICDNNFECKSNLCLDSQCVNQGLMQKLLNWFKSFGRRSE